MSRTLARLTTPLRWLARADLSVPWSRSLSPLAGASACIAKGSTSQPRWLARNGGEGGFPCLDNLLVKIQQKRAFRTSWSLSVYHHRVPQIGARHFFNGWVSSRFGNAFNFNEEIRMGKRGAECRARRKTSFRPRFRINLIHPSPILYAREDHRAFENTVKTTCRRL
jgi:hypothetical protein